ncbi:hypothetical protein EYY60_06855 [Flavobacterium zhairuonense]|uniref:hypothetical protein n=1 Tax=Flavobacterium zhairuonense TaxID=2493631 RepID=UPI0010464F7E|nr:hypothetical protein [Flavobacterium zhairuonense]KAF2512821.1 hypothetical protein EYY60_06855 [Flavobacterium zhairuonense]
MREILDDYFEYNNIDAEFSDAEVTKNLESLKKEFSKLSKNWNDQLNTQWVVRDYIAIKMILSSSVLLNSLEFANEKNLRIVEPYLIYYSLLNCSRAVILTSPFSDWNNEELFIMTHQKTINILGDIVSKYNKEKGNNIKAFIDWAREYREIFSYKFPANGLNNKHLSLNDAIEICRLLCEIAQLQSKVLENAISKNVKTDFDLDWKILSIGYSYGEKNFKFIDKEDGYRLDYITRKQKRPFSLHLTMTEGMVEDFFGAWYPEDDSNLDEIFNPDSNWRIIFPVP